MAEFRTARHFGELIPAMQMALEAAGICANVRLTKPSGEPVFACVHVRVYWYVLVCACVCACWFPGDVIFC